jgi:hypothetical protein
VAISNAAPRSLPATVWTPTTGAVATAAKAGA